MKHSTLIRFSVGISVAACSLLASANASAFNVENQIKWGRHHTTAFDSPRMRQIKAANAILDGTARPVGGLKRWTPAAKSTEAPPADIRV